MGHHNAVFVRSYAVGQNLLQTKANLKATDGKDIDLNEFFAGKKVTLKCIVVNQRLCT